MFSFVQTYKPIYFDSSFIKYLVHYSNKPFLRYIGVCLNLAGVFVWVYVGED